MGNLRSVSNAVEHHGYCAKIVEKPGDLENCDKLILPGVGAFADGMRHLEVGGWLDALRHQVIDKKKPILGICLGMQLFADIGTEHGEFPGLGWIKGRVVRIDNSANGLRVPHIGWNSVFSEGADTLYEGVEPGTDFYFVHSFIFQPEDESVVNGWFKYGQKFAASMRVGNIFATQYHPEKSQRAGLRVLGNFLQC